MCFVSAIYDYWGKQPWPRPRDLIAPSLPDDFPAIQPLPYSPPIIDPIQISKMIQDFRKTVEAARLIDELTGQPDCTDPEKEKLEERVKALEEQIAELQAASKKKKRGAKNK